MRYLMSHIVRHSQNGMTMKFLLTISAISFHSHFDLESRGDYYAEFIR